MQLESAPIPGKILRLADSEIEFTAKGKVQVIFGSFHCKLGQVFVMSSKILFT